MARASIPVDLINPGQVFACLGLLEAADVLLGEAEGGFDWTSEIAPRFNISADGDKDPCRTVLEFLITAQLERLAPEGFADTRPDDGPLCVVETFTAPRADRMALPLRLERDASRLDITHWCDASSRNSFKLFAGQQRSAAITRQMLDGIRMLWKNHQDALLGDPFGLTVPLGGSSFKFDARKSWTAIDAGYSPDEQTHSVEASPAVEMLGAIGLEHARPDEFDTREVRYGVWRGPLPPALARPALGAVSVSVPMRVFRFTLELAGKNKIVTFAREETYP